MFNTTVHALLLLAVIVRTVAGTTAGGGYADGIGAQAKFSSPNNLVACGGAIFVADSGNHAIRHITRDGVVTTWAGALTERGNADGERASARFNFPMSIAADVQCNLYVADTGNNAVRRISASGNVTTFGGFNAPQDLAVDANGRVWVADTGSKLIRLIATNGTVSNVAQIGDPRGIAIDGNGNALVANFGTSGSIVRITPSSQITTVSTRGGGYIDVLAAGGAIYALDFYGNTLVRIDTNAIVAGAQNSGGHHDGVGGEVRFFQPSGLALDEDGSLLIAERLNFDVRRATTDGVVSTLAGGPPEHVNVDGPRELARFSATGDIDVDAEGNVFVAAGSAVRRIARDGTVTTIAGSWTERGHRDGIGSDARFSGIGGLALAPNGDAIVVDGQRVRRVTQSGVVTTIAGQVDKVGLVDGVGDAALFNNPFAVGVGSDGIIYVCDTINRAIRKIEGNVVTTLHRDTSGLNLPTDLEVGADGNLYFWDENVSSAFRLTPAGERTTIAHDDSMMFAYHGIAVAPDGTIYVGGVSTRSNAIRRLAPGSSAFVTFAGVVESPGNQNGEALAARFFSPSVLTVAPNGRLYIADGNTAVRTFIVGELPSIATFTASAPSIRFGESVTLTWTTSGGTSARITPNVGEVALSGSVIVTPSSSTRYTLIVTNDAGDEIATTLVSVPRRTRAVRHP